MIEPSSLPSPVLLAPVVACEYYKLGVKKENVFGIKKGRIDEELGDARQCEAKSLGVPQVERGRTGRGNATARHRRVRRRWFCRRRIGLHKLWRRFPESAVRRLAQALLQRDRHRDSPRLTHRLRQAAIYGREQSGDLGCSRRRKRLWAREYGRPARAA